MMSTTNFSDDFKRDPVRQITELVVASPRG